MERRQRVRASGRLKQIEDITYAMIRQKEYMVAPSVIYLGVPGVGCMSISKKTTLVLVGEDERNSNSWRYATEEEIEKADKFMNRTEE